LCRFAVVGTARSTRCSHEFTVGDIRWFVMGHPLGIAFFWASLSDSPYER